MVRLFSLCSFLSLFHFLSFSMPFALTAMNIHIICVLDIGILSIVFLLDFVDGTPLITL